MPLNSTLTIASFRLQTTTKLPPAGKEYFCFQINGKSSHAAKCVKSRKMNKAINYILSIDTFEQQHFLIKGILQSLSLENQMKTIGIDQSLSNRPFVEHKCLNNIKIYINMLVNMMTNPSSRIFLMLIWFLLQSKLLMSVLVCI